MTWLSLCLLVHMRRAELARSLLLLSLICDISLICWKCCLYGVWTVCSAGRKIRTRNAHVAHATHVCLRKRAYLPLPLLRPCLQPPHFLRLASLLSRTCTHTQRVRASMSTQAELCLWRRFSLNRRDDQLLQLPRKTTRTPTESTSTTKESVRRQAGDKSTRRQRHPPPCSRSSKYRWRRVR